MSIEELIASFPVIDTNYWAVVLLIIAVVSTACALFAKEFNPPSDKIAPIAFILAFVLTIIGSTIALSTYIDHRMAIREWKTTTYQLYLEGQLSIEEEVTDYNVNEDGSITAIAEAADQSIVPYQKLRKIKQSTQGRNYISYVQVSGLESIGITDGKELVTFHKNK